MDKQKVEYIEVTNPLSKDYQQSMFWCQDYFDLSIQEILDISKKLKNSKDLHFLVVKEEEKVIGFSMFYYLSEVKLSYLEFIFVRSEYQGLGLGSSLYRETLNTLQKNHPEVKGMVLEVENGQTGFWEKKQFFLNQGALPVDLAFYSIPKTLKESGIMLMFHPLKVGIKLTDELINSMIADLATALLH